MTTHSRSQRRGWGCALLVLALCAASACASVQRPVSVDEAKATISSRDRARLKASRPQLVAQADRALSEAERALNKGDAETADLYARQAMARYKTAREFVRRDEAQALAKTMERARKAGAESESEAKRHAEELARFSALDGKVRALDAEIASRDAATADALQQAKGVLAEARVRQSEAIDKGAPVRAAARYESGRSLVEGSVESLGVGLADDARQSATMAIAAFDAAIRESTEQEQTEQEQTEQEQAERGQAERGQAEREAMQKAIPAVAAVAAGSDGIDQGVEATARRAIEAAQRASVGASGRGLILGQSFLLQARSAYTDASYAEATQAARDAQQAFMQEPSSGGSNALAVTVGGLSHAQVEDRLVALQFEKSELLGKRADELCAPEFREYSSIIELSAERLKSGDVRRAEEFLIRADERLRGCRLKVSATVKPLTDAEFKAADRARAADAMRGAQTLLAAKKGQGIDDRSLAEGQALLASAERWFKSEDYAQAEKSAQGAASALSVVARPRPAAEASVEMDVGARRKLAAAALMEGQTALTRAKRTETGTARIQEAGALLTDADRWFERKEYDTTLVLSERALRVLNGPSSAPLSEAEAPDPRAEAEDAIAEAERSVAQATAAGIPAARVAVSERLIRSAQAWYDRKSYEKAKSFANLASDKLTVSDDATRTGGPGAVTPGKTAAAAAQVTPGPSASCKDAWESYDATQSLAARTDRTKLSNEQRTALGEAEGLIAVANRRVKEEQCQKGVELLTEAQRLLRGLPRGALPKQSSMRPHEHGGPKTASKSGSIDPRAAAMVNESLARVSALRDRAAYSVQPATKSAFDQGSASLTQARIHATQRDHESALRATDAAARAFSTVLSASAAAVEQRATTVIEQSVTQPGTDAAVWGPAYKAVYKALAVRDEAHAVRGKSDPNVEDADALMKRANAAWKQKNYTAARKLAGSASASYERALAGDTESGVAEPAQAEPVSYRDADTKVQEAEIVLRVCEQQGCADRDAKAFATAQQRVEAARRALEQEQYAYAAELAQQAAQALNAILAQPKAKADSPLQADPVARRGAEASLREAGIQKKLCEAERCARANYEMILRAQESLAAATAAFADERYAEAKELADAAAASTQEARRAQPVFAIPEAASGVSRSGNRLLVTPAVDFSSGGATIVPASSAAVLQVAEVLRANDTVIRELRVVGHTDSRGNARKNRALSEARARAVADAIRGHGVGRVVVSAEGAGSDEPVADNRTESGRRDNRRVEFHMTLTEQP